MEPEKLAEASTRLLIEIIAIGSKQSINGPINLETLLPGTIHSKI